MVLEKKTSEKSLTVNVSRKNYNRKRVSKYQLVEPQKYTITTFEEDYKDWLQCWNQFEVKVDHSKIAKISKFNYMIELV